MEETKNGIKILDVKSLKNIDSPYVKPVRLFFEKDGKTLNWDYIKTHDSVAILIYNASRNVLVFVRQLRPPVYFSTLLSKFNLSIDTKVEILQEKAKQLDRETGYTLELCAGIIDKDGLSPKEIAREEIIEETGYQPPLESLEMITSYRYGVGTSGSLQYLFFCQVNDSMRINSGGGVDDESIEVIELSIEESRKQIYANDETSGIGRPAGLRLAISWFMSEKLPKIQKN